MTKKILVVVGAIKDHRCDVNETIKEIAYVFYV